MLGIGGYAYGDRNDQIDLTTCTPVSNADDINPEDLKRPVWGTQFTLQQVYEILIGPKNDPFCFVVFPGADSVIHTKTLNVLLKKNSKIPFF